MSLDKFSGVPTQRTGDEVTMFRRNIGSPLPSIGILSYRAVKTSELATLYCLTVNTRRRKVRHCHLDTAQSKECSYSFRSRLRYSVVFYVIANHSRVRSDRFGIP